MNTEIKNTLFRFVTMRAPELSDENQKDKRFVFRKQKTHDSLFDEAVKSKSPAATNWQALQSAAAAFVPLTEAALKTTIHPDYLDFATWIARNKHSFSTQELLEKLRLLKNSSTTAKLVPETLTLLWNNLFYQVATQKDFYIKETLMQLLIANHIYENIDLVEKEYEKAARKLKNPVYETQLIKNVVNAKVVLPKELFGEKTAAVSGASRTSIENIKTAAGQPIVSVPSEEMKQFVAASEAKINLDRYSKLKAELQKIEKSYRREYQESYDKAAEEHQARIEPIMEEYNRQMEQNRVTWCANRNLIQFGANDPCNQPPAVPKPKLPKFEFKFRHELDLDYLQPQLTQDSFHALLDVLGIGPEANDKVSETGTTAPSAAIPNQSSGQTSASVPIVSLFRTASGDASKTSTALGTRFTDTLAFSDVYSLVNSAVNASSETIIGNTPSQGNASVSIGGVIVPVAPRQAVPFGYQVCSRIYKSRSEPRNAIDYVTFDMILDLPDSTWIIIGVQTAVTQNAVTTASSVFNPLRIGNSVRLNSLYTQGLLYSAFSSGIADLAVTITFSNGAVKKFSSGFWNTISCLSGILSPVKDAPVLTPDPGSAGPSNPVKAEDNFIPSGFGVKRLGIADYKKVEQTVQGYVEGDVAHIENIMAREYKDKATRRLRRSENTETNSSESEREKLSDTTTADRFEMQAETAKILQEGKDLSAGASFNADFGRFNLATNVNMATHSSKEESNRQAVTQAKEVTERAMERIVAKVKQERIEKIVEEFEENNKHGFDNTKGDKHVVGVYRWVDKVYKNQVLNYGKRLMFEFMVPEPAKLHLLGMSENKGLTSLVKPADPREFEDPAGAAILLNLKDYSKVNENTAKYWGGMFNADLAPMPEQTIYIGKSFYYQAKEIASNAYERAAESAELDIPEGYKATMAAAASRDTNDYLPGPYTRAQVLVGNKVMSETFSSINSFQNKIPVSYSQLGFLASSANISIQCELTAEAKIKWQQETFKAIIKAYKEALAAYEQKLAAENASGTKIKGENPGFYRQIENMILRKNCISYIIDQNEAAGRTYGKNMFKPLAPGSDRKFTNHEVNVGPALDDYAAFSKFIEQAFEWEIMSYNFYPYYWGAKEDWPMLYQYDNNDPLFRSFMQAGMARVVVTVRPGFEEAVNYYMQTGQIWNGGEVPIIEDKLFMAIADELRQPEGQKIGKAWPTRLPTALTVLQAQAIGLNVTKALPFDENLSDFENPESVPQSAGLGFSEAQLGISQKARVVGKIRGNQNKEAKIMLKNLDGTTHDLTYCDARGNWELNDIPAAKYQLLLDADNDFPAPQFQVIQGSKEHMIELSGGQTLEVNLTLNSIPGQTP